MNSALAALFGAVGGGARSYGQNTIREEQQAALEQQRMNELKQQEQARLKERQMVIDAAESERRRTRESGINSLRIADPNFTAPEGDFDPQVALRVLLDKQTTGRANAKMEADAAAKAQANRARYGTLSKSGRLPKGSEFNPSEDYTEWSRILGQEDAQSAAQSGRQFIVDNRRDPSPSRDPAAEMTAKRALELMQPQRGEFGMSTPGLSPQAARAQAEREVQAAMGQAQPAAPAYTANPQNAEGALMQQLNAAIQQINALPIDAQEKQARIQEANRRATERARQMRGGR